jgi:hypothetical protein
VGYAMWRRYLKLAQGYTAAHPDGIVSYTANELRHVCASLLIASGASDVQVATKWGTARSAPCQGSWTVPARTSPDRKGGQKPYSVGGIRRFDTCQ